MKARINKILSVFLVVMMLITAAPLSGFAGLELSVSAATYSGTCGDGVTWSFDDTTGELVIEGSGAMDDYYSSSYAPWYSYRSSIKKVTIGNSVTRIGGCAFIECQNLTNITIPDSVASIGYNAFSGCTGLKSITVSEDNTAYSSDEYGVLFNKNKTKLIRYPIGNTIGEYIIPDSVTNIVDSAFSGCTGLTSVTIPESVTSIGEYAFHKCTGLTSVTIPESVTSIGDDAFSGCIGLTSVIIPDSVTSIGDSAFSGRVELYVKKDSCAATYAENNDIIYYYTYDESEDKFISVEVTSKLSFEINKETYTITINCSGNMPSFSDATAVPWADYEPYIKHVVINEGCTSIGAFAFDSIKGLKSVDIPDGITKIDTRAFFYCNLEAITIPDSVTSIGAGAFSGCTSLTSVTIPDSVTSIGDSAFSGCTSLTSITVAEDNTAYSSDEYGVLFDKNKTMLIQYPVANNRTSYVIPDSVTSIDDYAFDECTGLTSVTIPDGVTFIGEYTFDGCQNITEVTIPVSTVLEYAFGDCKNIQKLTLTKGDGTVATNFTRWYTGAETLTELVVEEGVTGIRSRDFAGCTNLGSVDLPYTVKSIGINAFVNCQSMEKLKVYNPECVFGASVIDYYTTIVGYAGSTAEAYAEENGYEFELIGDDDHQHIYSNSCDDKCNICGFVRTGIVHVYSNGCDAQCDICGYVREDLTHTYTDNCDTQCNNCDFTRNAPHTDEDINGECDSCYTLLSDIQIGVTQNFTVEPGETLYLKFVPAQSGVYTFYSSSPTDTRGYIYNADKLEIAKDDDSGEGYNFSITYTFKAGTVYYLVAQYYSSDDSGEMPLTIRLDESICDHIKTHTEHKESTCSDTGYDSVVCDECGETVSYTQIPVKPHSYKEIVAKPTCQSAGSVVYYCTECKDAYIGEITDPVDHAMSWVLVTKPTNTADGEMHYTCSYCGLVENTKIVPAFLISNDSVASIDFTTNTISGFDAGVTSVDDYLTVTNEGYVFTCSSETIGTGSLVELTDGETVIGEFTAVIFGDVNGDGWYDGTDSIIVSCLANGLISEDDISPAFYKAADCNHDGVVDSLDVALLEQAGILLSNIDQSKSPDELTTDAAYIEYVELIDQSPEEETTESNLVEFIISIIKNIIELIIQKFSY